MQKIISILVIATLLLSCNGRSTKNQAKFTVKQQYYFSETANRYNQNNENYSPESTVYFYYNDFRLNPMAKEKLTTYFAGLNKNLIQIKQYYVEGNTDSSGGQDYNYELSRKRAQTVIDYLIGLGFPSDNLILLPKGELNPVADNANTPELNRRVTIYIKN